PVRLCIDAGRTAAAASQPGGELYRGPRRTDRRRSETGDRRRGPEQGEVRAGGSAVCCYCSRPFLARFWAPLLYNVSGVPPNVPPKTPPGTLGPGELIPFSRGRLSLCRRSSISAFVQDLDKVAAERCVLHGGTAQPNYGGNGPRSHRQQASVRSDKWIIPQ